MKIIKLTQGKEVFVDDEDFEGLSKYKWYAQKSKATYYVRRSFINEQGYQINPSMHREITRCPDEMQVDHIDGNGLNNCKSNLRIVTPRQNSQNKHSIKKSPYVGIYFDENRQRWVAKIAVNNKIKYLGTYKNPLTAHKAYVRALKKINEPFVSEVNAVGVTS
jgi:hypothetical protein